MATVEEAAALFGSADSASDPFASVTNPPNARAADDPFAPEESTAATELFAASGDESNYFSSATTYAAQSSGGYTTQSADPWGAPSAQTSDYSAHATQAAGSGNSGYGTQGSQGNWTGQQGQWSGYEQQQYSTPVNGSQASYSQPPVQQQYGQHPSYPSAYDPLAPAVQDIKHTTTYGSYAPRSAYDPPAVAPKVQATYDPYKPAQYSVPATAAPPAPAQYSVPVPPVPAPVQPAYVPAPAPSIAQVPVVEPPQPARATTPASAYRPKTLNAYDPPLPPPKPATKRVAGFHPPAQPQYAFGNSPAPVYGMPHTAPLPPPRAGSAAPPAPPPRTGSAALPPPPRAGSVALPPPRSGSAALPPPRGTTSSVPPPMRSPALRQYASPSPPTYHHPPVPPVDAYASPPRPQHPALDAFQTSPKQSPVMAHYSVNHTQEIKGHAVPYSPPSGWAPIKGRASGQFDTLSNLSLDSIVDDEVAEIRQVFGAESPQHELFRQVAQEEFAHEEVEDGIAWPATSPKAAVFNVPPTHGASALEAHQTVEDGEAAWGDVVGKAPTPEPSRPVHAYAGSPHSSPQVVPTSPKAHMARAPTSSVSSKGSLGSPPLTYEPYKPNGSPAPAPPPPRVLSPERTRSPGTSSIKSSTSSQRRSIDHVRGIASPPVPPYPPIRGSQGPPSVGSQGSPVVKPYEPPVGAAYPNGAAHRTASPASVRSIQSGRSVPSGITLVHRDSSTYDPYSPPVIPVPPAPRDRSMSNTSAFSTAPADPYAPVTRARQPTIDGPTYGAFAAIKPPYMEQAVPPLPVSVAQPQVVSLAPTTAAPYAPSPSLLGSNDPLGRTSVRVPVISFGFGGKLVTCFHTTSVLNTGFDVAMSARASTDIQIRPLHKIIPQATLDSSTASYPGPLFSDSVSAATTLVRTGGATQAKTKKAAVIKYLEERAEEASRGLGYLNPGSMEGYQAEAKRVLISLLKVMVTNDGRLSGSPQIDSAVRAALLPSLDLSADVSAETLRTPALGFGAAGAAPGYASGSDATIAICTLRKSHLEKIQDFLLRGERRAAYQYAADEKLWAHAMVIASSLDQEAWKDIVNEFVRSELASGNEDALGRSHAASSVVACKESLRVAYSLFSGHGAAAVQELMPPKPLASLSQLQPMQPTVAPVSPNIPPPFQPSAASAAVLSKWAQTLAMIVSSPMTTELSSAVTALGDQLAANGWIEAAHACYLLSPQTSLVGGVGASSVRVTLYGANTARPNFWKDADPTIFSEIAEFALSLTPVTKGQEPFPGLPHLQPYRLIRASFLAELGHVQVANRYCDAISNSLTRHSPYLNGTFIEQLRGLSDRLIAAPMEDKAGGWIGGKMAKPSLDKIGNWLEGRFTSFITGEAESPKSEETRIKEHTFSGPFAHYSTISSTTSSTMPSPQMSTTNLAEMHSASVPTRTGSAMAVQFTSNGTAIARASSAIDYLRRKPSPVPRISSASAAAPNFSNLPAWGQQPNGYAPIPEMTPKAERTSKLAEVHVEEDESTQEAPGRPQIGSWWGASETDSRTPTASSFDHSQAPAMTASNEGFISLMDVPSFGAAPSQSKLATSRFASDEFGEDDDDLGLSNSSLKKPNVDASAQNEEEGSQPEPVAHTESTKEESKHEEDKSGAAGGGWFSRLWKRQDTSTPAPVKANLGEQSAFYFDKELGRWVNKNAPAEETKSAAPAPPPRAQTASPATHPPRGSGAPLPSPGPPPARPATASDLTNGPPKKVPTRIKSNLVPDDASAPPTPGSAGPPRTPSTMIDGLPGLDGPPTAGARAKAKRGARNRYVDVFQQESSN